MPLLARVSAVAPPLSLCPLSDMRSLCAPLPSVCPSGHQALPSGIGLFFERSIDILRRPSAHAAAASPACRQGYSCGRTVERGVGVGVELVILWADVVGDVGGGLNLYIIVPAIAAIVLLFLHFHYISISAESDQSALTLLLLYIYV